MNPYVLLLGFQFGCTLGIFAASRRMKRYLRMSLRRERVTAKVLDAQTRFFIEPCEDSSREVLMAQVAAADELAAQANLPWWRGVPKVGKPWPDWAERAPIAEQLFKVEAE